MRKHILAAVCMILLTGCTRASGAALLPLMGLDWFTGYEEAKAALDSCTLLDERESTDEKVPQKMQDYTGAALFDVPCDLTLCFTDSGLIGFNYHDIERNQTYREWYSTLETTYGLPTEEGSGMASWYDNPAGKDTAIYLFNLEEGVQVSIYATADSPDKSYDRTVDVYIPTPEIRTPIVPVTDEPARTTEPVSSEETAQAPSLPEETATAPREVLRPGETAPPAVQPGVPAASEQTETSGTSETAETTGTTGTTVTSQITTEEPLSTEPMTEDKTDDFLQNGLQFYGSPDTERRKMSAYTQLYEYRTEEPGQPWELIMEYENVPYFGKNCDGVLCFTSLGLVGINYFDSNTSDYNFWVQSLTELYGTPDDTQYDYTAWSSAPVGSGTMIYVFALEDGVQISFFADDTGSELT